MPEAYIFDHVRTPRRRGTKVYDVRLAATVLAAIHKSILELKP